MAKQLRLDRPLSLRQETRALQNRRSPHMLLPCLGQVGFARQCMGSASAEGLLGRGRGKICGLLVPAEVAKHGQR